MHGYPTGLLYLWQASSLSGRSWKMTAPRFSGLFQCMWGEYQGNENELLFVAGNLTGLESE